MKYSVAVGVEKKRKKRKVEEEEGEAGESASLWQGADRAPKKNRFTPTVRPTQVSFGQQPGPTRYLKYSVPLEVEEKRKKRKVEEEEGEAGESAPCGRDYGRAPKKNRFTPTVRPTTVSFGQQPGPTRYLKYSVPLEVQEKKKKT